MLRRDRVTRGNEVQRVRRHAGVLAGRRVDEGVLADEAAAVHLGVALGTREAAKWAVVVEVPARTVDGAEQDFEVDRRVADGDRVGIGRVSDIGARERRAGGCNRREGQKRKPDDDGGRSQPAASSSGRAWGGRGHWRIPL
jgi:hypothetical protein